MQSSLIRIGRAFLLVAGLAVFLAGCHHHWRHHHQHRYHQHHRGDVPLVLPG